MSVFTTYYTLRASAVRGAKRAGLKVGEFGVEETERDGNLVWMVVGIDDAIEETVVPTLEEINAVGEEPPATKSERKRAKSQKSAEIKQMTPDEAMQYKANCTDKNGHLRASVIRQGAVERVHSLCREAFDADTNKMTATRAELMALCENQGIAFYTARTQIQKWAKMTGISFPKKGEA